MGQQKSFEASFENEKSKKKKREKENFIFQCPRICVGIGKLPDVAPKLPHL